MARLGWVFVGELEGMSNASAHLPTNLLSSLNVFVSPILRTSFDVNIRKCRILQIISQCVPILVHLTYKNMGRAQIGRAHV